MPKLYPFKAIRPVKHKVHLVVSKSIESYQPNELKYEWTFNPFSFLRVIKPGESYPEKKIVQTTAFLRTIKSTLQQRLAEGIFEKEQQDCFYIYRQSNQEKSFTGIIALVSVNDYENGKILIHEQTLTEREEKLMHYLQICDFNAEPVLMFHRQDKALEQIMDDICAQNHLYDFSTNDGLRHQVWSISEKELKEKIDHCFQQHENFYIADGHHRSASSVLLSKFKHKHAKPGENTDAFNYFLTAIFSEKELKIYDFNRVVTDLNHHYEEDFLELLKENFVVEEKGELEYKPAALHEISLYLGGYWYKLTIKPHLISSEKAAGTLDAALLTDLVLAPILGIQDLKTDKRIAFVNGTKGLKALQQMVDSGKMKAAFALYPVTMEQLKGVAEEGSIMPPKSTYVEPKLRSGLLIYNMHQD
jgi:uncharacterized protein (DUF1015 family)